jgi:hypothetical protein
MLLVLSTSQRRSIWASGFDQVGSPGQYCCQNFVSSPLNVIRREYNLAAGDFAAVLNIRPSSRPADRRGP